MSFKTSPSGTRDNVRLEYVFTADDQSDVFWACGAAVSLVRVSGGGGASPGHPCATPLDHALATPWADHGRLATEVCFVLWSKRRAINHGVGGA